MFCHLVVLVRLSVPVQVIDWKDSSPNLLIGTLNPTHSLSLIQLINRLHSATIFPPMRVRTSHFKNSFIPFSVAKLSSSYVYYFIFILVCECYLHVCFFKPAFGCHNAIKHVMLDKTITRMTLSRAHTSANSVISSNHKSNS